MDFYQALAETYCLAPAAVLPNALWKTAAEIPSTQHSFQRTEGQISELKMWDQQRLLLYWTQSPNNANYSAFNPGNLKLALVHERMLPFFPTAGFSGQKAYFKATHSLAHIPAYPLPAGYHFQAVKLPLEAEQVTAFINACYPHISLNTDTVLGWTQHSVFMPALWQWVIESGTGQPAALGIAEYDAAVREGALEWIQVSPQYRRQGLGKCLVAQLLALLTPQAVFVTVSGEQDHPEHPARLYQSCGFADLNTWWVFTR